MLVLKDILKYYEVAGTQYWALRGVNLAFRESEFVAILGQSGSGKTTLLNIIGGLDRYSEGDLIIDNVSTKLFKDKDWDAYRNHRVGFVFQNYNLIPHLNVLDNVELALTLSGVNIKERRQRAKDVLVKVGLEDHLTKKPNQLSGGQQQRVAIARALVNDPSIILADEPTGALDSDTSVEIMEILKAIAKDKLIIMVTHNENLASTYAERIIKLEDGNIIGDSQPFEMKEVVIEQKKQKTSMSYFTALRLSFKNLLTKKFRTIITAFAGSIGIIGVGLVLSLQYGFTSYLNDMERGTFAGLPIQISTQFFDLGGMMDPENFLPGDPVVDGGFIGRDPNPSELVGTNKITMEFVNHLNDSQISNHADVVEIFGFRIFAFNEIENTLFPTPTAPGLLGDLFPPSPLIVESQYSDGFLSDFTRTLASYDGNFEFGASLVLSSTNTVQNAVLEFLGLPQSIELDYQDVLGKTFKVLLNDALWFLDPTAQGIIPGIPVFNMFSNDQIHANWDNLSSDAYVEITIVDVIQSSTSFVTFTPGIMLHQDTTRFIHDTNMESAVVQAQLQMLEAQPNFEIPIIAASLIPQFVSSEHNIIDQILTAIGGAEAPGTILIYPLSFEDKEAIMAIIDDFNQQMLEQDRPDYVIHAMDNIAAALSMMSQMMDTISIVLIVFAAVSLVVSSVMIGIITYTSVLERTKEIGILRSVGARKRDISRVFSAETIIVGFTAGVMGVLITYSLVPIINHFLHQFTDGVNIAELSWFYAISLVAISVLLTLTAGLFPSRIASNKHPVDALRISN